MRVYNTMTRQLEEFAPIDADRVRMYTCGPTVYNFAHIGNFRAYIFEDVLRRHLKFLGFDVVQVMNLTDVDDKTIKGARAAGVSLGEYTRKYKDAFFEDLRLLNIESAEFYPAATDHVEEMKALIARLLDRGCAYRSDDGTVYFNVSKFKNYGRLSHLDASGLRAGARVVHDEYDKENLADFALWKAWDEDDGDVVWEAPWGRGRPGWHIECSAMSMKYLGDSFDLHTGGIDNMFPHHENEIAQSEAATGKQFVKYWMHCGYLGVNGEKMAKSLGNFHTVRQVLEKGYSGRELRYVLMNCHYRQPLDFTFEALGAARAAVDRMDQFRDRLAERAGESTSRSGAPTWAQSAATRFKSALDEDLNMPEAMAAVFDMIRDGNRAMDNKEVDAGAAAAALAVLRDADRVLGILEAAEENPGPEALRLVEERREARAARDWAEADRIRDELARGGWVVQDTPQGPKVRRIKR